MLLAFDFVLAHFAMNICISLCGLQRSNSTHYFDGSLEGGAPNVKDPDYKKRQEPSMPSRLLLESFH